MDFISSFSAVGSAIFQLIFLAGCGFILARRGVLGPETLQVLSKVIMNLFLPFFIFHRFINNFTFAQFPRWWIYPFFSFAIIGIAFLLGYLSLLLIPQFKEKREFISAITFSNAGYLPLVLIAGLFDGEVASRLFIYLFLFLLGFNLVMWSFGVRLLGGKSEDKNNISKLFTAPVIAVLVGLIAVFFKVNSFIPTPLLKSLGMLGDCTLPLAMIVVGANLALIKIGNILENRELQLIVFIKLILMPFLAFFILLFFDIEPLVKFLLLLEAAMPCAVSLSVICRNFNLKGELANQAIFWTHICLIFTLPFFLLIFKEVASLV